MHHLWANSKAFRNFTWKISTLNEKRSTAFKAWLVILFCTTNISRLKLSLLTIWVAMARMTFTLTMLGAQKITRTCNRNMKISADSNIRIRYFRKLLKYTKRELQQNESREGTKFINLWPFPVEDLFDFFVMGLYVTQFKSSKPNLHICNVYGRFGLQRLPPICVMAQLKTWGESSLESCCKK